MNYIINDNKRQKIISVRCIKNGSYTVLSIDYNDDNKVDILKTVMEYVCKLESMD
jgi:hypothetical protein